MLLVPNFEPAPIVKAMFNIGALMDVPTGIWLSGQHGEKILNGGLGALTGIVGIGNNFKSTMMHYMLMSAMDKILPQAQTSASIYDTEINVHEEHINKLAQQFASFHGKDIFEEKLWVNTDSTVYWGNAWFEKLKEFLKEKDKQAKSITVDSPFIGRDGKLMKMLIPTFGEIDSFTEFKSEAEAKMLDANELGDSGANTYHMRAGLIKSRFLMEAPAIMGKSYHYLAMTGQLGKDIPISTGGPMPAQPTKKLQFLKGGDKIKGVTDKFSFATNNCWHAYNAAPLINQGTKAAEYPVSGANQYSGDTDLMLVSLRQLRSKSGPTGYVLPIVVSQSEGVLPSLTEFHYIKSNNRWGMGGNLQHYNIVFLPDVSLQRTTVRSKIEENPLLQRALNIAAEMLQIKIYHRSCDDIICTPEELYNDLKKMGYDWNMLLQTRGWWTINNDTHPTPFLSTRDMLEMRQGTYAPYWLDPKDKTKINPKFKQLKIDLK